MSGRVPGEIGRRRKRGETHWVVIDSDGRLRFVYDDALHPLLSEGAAAITRASHVEPEGLGWAVDLSPCGGPQLGTFPLRSEALAAERKWIERQVLGAGEKSPR